MHLHDRLEPMLRIAARLGAHLRSSSTASQLSRWPRLMDAAVRAAATDQRVFDDVAYATAGRLHPQRSGSSDQVP